MMLNNKKSQNFLYKALLYLVVFFPLIVVLGSAAINITTALLIIVFLFYINITIINQNDFFNNHLFIYFFFFFLFILINSILNEQDYQLIIKSIGNFRYLLLSVAIFFVLENINEEQKKFLIYFNIILMIFICGDIIYQYFFYKNIFGFKPGMCNDFVTFNDCSRFSGVFGDELIAGGYLSQVGMLFLFLFYFFDFKKNNPILKKKNILFLGLFLVIIITGERNATLIFFLTIIILFFFEKKLLNILLLISLIVFIIFSLGTFSKKIEQRYINPIKSLNKLSLPDLYENLIDSPWGHHYEAAIELFLEKPIFGHGPKSFRVVCEKTKIQKKLKEKNFSYLACTTHPHNYLLEFLSENGIIGGIFYLGFIFIIFYQIFKLRKNNHPEKIITIALGSLILAIIFPFKPSGSFLSTYNASMLFYIIGFYSHYIKKIR